MDKRKFGYVPDIKDPLDRLFSLRPMVLAPIAEESDLEPLCSPIEDQRQMGSCVANAAVGALEFLEKKDNVPFVDLSRLMVYYNARAFRGLENQDQGCMIRDAMKTLAKFGTCHEATWPYQESLLFSRPDERAREEGSRHQIIEYRRLTTESEILSCLSEGYPVEFGLTLYSSFEPDDQGFISDPHYGSEQTLGGHAMLFVGHKRSIRRFKVRNSWGKWGKDGYCWISFDYIGKCGSDFWTIRRMEQ